MDRTRSHTSSPVSYGFDLAFQRSLLDFGGVHFLQYILAGLVPLGSLINGFVA